MKNHLLLSGLCLLSAAGSISLSACASTEEEKRTVTNPGTGMGNAGENAGENAGQNTGGGDAGASSGGSGEANTGMTQPPPVDDTDAGDIPNTPVEPGLVAGCEGQKLRAGIPSDLGKPGPWPVGAVTTMLGGVVTEVWYPAKFGSEAQKDKVIYELEEHLPTMEQGKIKPKERQPFQTCNCYADLPLDDAAGPYPVLVFVHGTAGFRTTNMENVTHWASRGFVVVASDHPGIQLANMLDGLGGAAGAGSADQAGDARKVLLALASPSGDIAFLKDHIDLTRVGAMGHSAGANAVSSLSDVADVIIPYAGGSALTAGRVKSAMFVTGDKDAVVAPTTSGYDGTTAAPKRRVWIKNGGHLVGGSLCVIRDPTDPTKDIVKLANEFRIGNLLIRPVFGNLFDGCNATPDATDGSFIATPRGIDILSYVSAGQFEEALHCSATAAGELAKTQEVFGDDVSQYAENMP